MGPPNFASSRLRDARLLPASAVAGLACWFLYLAIQPRDYARPHGSPDRLDTLFGWRAPSIDPDDFIERSRLFVALAGWAIIALIAPHEAQGYWTLDFAYLVLAAPVLSVIALVAPDLDQLLRNRLLLAGVAGGLLGMGLLTGARASVFRRVGQEAGTCPTFCTSLNTRPARD